ncbi:MAG TPA: glycoside hydrolase family 20 zincin-like fold domain-containing protein, partial [Ferruginibacter sp.]|nr:glycoside hydrolase family 20 zincin-like fold domain-containing protein [Ferruginibacter sp.]
MKKILLIALLLNTLFAAAQNTLDLVPMPAEVKMDNGSFQLNRNTRIVLEGSGLEKTASLLNEYINASLGYSLKVVNQYSDPNSISLNYERLDKDIPGAYNLVIGKKGVYIAGDNAAGVFYGIQTLLQLIQSNTKLPYLSISDYPRFGYRGIHLDVSRHFFPLSFIKKYIDYLAAYKFNTFHWHLTDDQGWR